MKLDSAQFSSLFDFLISPISAPDFPDGVVGVVELSPVNARYVFELVQQNKDFLNQHLSGTHMYYIEAVLRSKGLGFGVVFSKKQHQRLSAVAKR